MRVCLRIEHSDSGGGGRRFQLVKFGALREMQSRRWEQENKERWREGWREGGRLTCHESGKLGHWSLFFLSLHSSSSFFFISAFLRTSCSKF